MPINNYLITWDAVNLKWVVAEDGGTPYDLIQNIKLPDGAKGTPSLAFGDDINTGLFSPSDDKISLVTAGAERWQVDDSGDLFPVDGEYNFGHPSFLIDHVYAKKYIGIVLASFGFSMGQYSAGSSDTQLDSYDVTIPINLLTQPGDFLLIEGTFVFADNANTKTVRHQLDSTTKMISAQSSVQLSNMIVRTQAKLLYRTSTTGSWGGVSWIDASAAAPTSGQGYLHNAGLSGADWTSAQTLKLWGQGSVNDDVRATDYTVMAFLGISGVTV